MTEQRDLTLYLNEGIEQLISDIIKSTFQNPKETAFLLQYREKNRKSLQKRTEYEAKGQHIPAFLISSITNSCNLFCKGCYARANGICNNQTVRSLLTTDEWIGIIEQAARLGVTFNLLAGGEPLMRRDVIEAAGNVPEILSAIFTNGTLIDASYLKLFDKHRNLIPVISIEGGLRKTDERRGTGTYDRLSGVMSDLNQSKILYGASITVTTENLDEITSPEFLDLLKETGCRLIFYIEYVPVDRLTKHLALGEKERVLLDEKLTGLRTTYPAMMFLSFPGDEKEMGGCLAAGRGFFHINPYGDAEACPFSPYSDRSLRTHTLLEVLQSPFFRRLQDEKLVGGEHDGGCALFEHEDIVKKCLAF